MDISSRRPVNVTSPKFYLRRSSDRSLGLFTWVTAEGEPAAAGVLVLDVEVPVFIDPEHGCIRVPA